MRFIHIQLSLTMDPTTRHLSDYRAELYRLFGSIDNESANESKSSDDTFFGNNKQLSPRPILANAKQYITEVPTSSLELPSTPPNLSYSMDELQTSSFARKILPQKENIWQDTMLDDTGDLKFQIWPNFSSSPIPLSPPTSESYFQNPNFFQSIPNISEENVTRHTLSPIPSTPPSFFQRQPLYNRGNHNFATQSLNNECIQNKSGNTNCKAVCTFCKKNGETPVVYSSHPLRERVGGKSVVSCPVLRSHICGTCGETGDNAHTVTYCPILRNANRGMALPSTAITLKSSRVKSNGKRRY